MEVSQSLIAIVLTAEGDMAMNGVSPGMVGGGGEAMAQYPSTS